MAHPLPPPVSSSPPPKGGGGAVARAGSTSSSILSTPLDEEDVKAEEFAANLDKYGFIRSSQDANVSSQPSLGDLSPATARRNSQKLARRELKWSKMTSKWDEWVLHSARKQGKIKERCRKGIPESMRGKAWQSLCGAATHPDRAQCPDLFRILAAQEYAADDPVQKFLDVIEKDLNRTFPHHILFKDINGHGQDSMRHVLRAYVGFDPVVGYCQGMGFVVGTLLMYMLEEEAFWCLVRLMQQPQYILGFFDDGLVEIQVAAAILPDLLKDVCPRLHEHMHVQNNVMPILFMQDWFMCVFVKTLPWDSLVRVWDMFFFEGRKVLYRIALAILVLNQDSILAIPNDGEMLMFLRNVPRETLEPNALLEQALKIKFKRERLDALHALRAAEFPARGASKPVRSPSKAPSVASPARSPSAAVAANSATTLASVGGGAVTSPSRMKSVAGGKGGEERKGGEEGAARRKESAVGLDKGASTAAVAATATVTAVGAGVETNGTAHGHGASGASGGGVTQLDDDEVLSGNAGAKVVARNGGHGTGAGRVMEELEAAAAVAEAMPEDMHASRDEAGPVAGGEGGHNNHNGHVDMHAESSFSSHPHHGDEQSQPHDSHSHSKTTTTTTATATTTAAAAATAAGAAASTAAEAAEGGDSRSHDRLSTSTTTAHASHAQAEKGGVVPASEPSEGSEEMQGVPDLDTMDDHWV